MTGATAPIIGGTLDDLVEQALRCQVPTREQALAVLGSSDDDLLDAVAAGGRVRRHFFVNRVKLNLIINLKSGLCPDTEVRIAGGSELHLRTLQALGLHLANCIFLGDYLTSEGQAGSDELQMMSDAGFVVEGRDEETLPKSRRALVALRCRARAPRSPPTRERGRPPRNRGTTRRPDTGRDQPSVASTSADRARSPTSETPVRPSATSISPRRMRSTWATPSSPRAATA